MKSERGLVERVKKLIPEQEPWVGETARAIIEEVAEAMEEAFKSGKGVNPTLNEGLVWANWLRAQAQESEK